jgi:hypothetical protein
MCASVVRDEADADLRWRTRTFDGVALGGAAGGVALWGAAFRGGAPLSGRPAVPVLRMVLVPRVVLLLVVMTAPEESVHRMDLDNLRRN